MSRLTVLSRERLIRRHLEEHLPLRVLAAQAGISLRTAYKWLARYRAGGAAALADRRSVRHRQRRTLDPRLLQQAIDLRHQRYTLRRIARLLQVPPLHGGQGHERSWHWRAAQHGAATANAAIRVAEAGGHD